MKKTGDHSYRIQSNPIHGWIQSMSNSELITSAFINDYNLSWYYCVFNLLFLCQHAHRPAPCYIVNVSFMVAKFAVFVCTDGVIN